MKTGVHQEGNRLNQVHTVQEQMREMEQTREKLARIITQICTHDGFHDTAIPSLRLIRRSQVTEPIYTLHEPALCVVVQGKKVSMLADESYLYGPSDYLVVSVDLPISGEVIEASPEMPYLCIRMEIDPHQVLDVMKESNLTPRKTENTRRGLYVSQASHSLLDAAMRLVNLLDTPGDIPVLAPLITREILYRILNSDQGESLKQIAMTGSHSYRIAQVIHKLKRDYAQPLRIEELATLAHMSPSSLHRYFKDVTAMSPLQYQKQVRLQEARRILLTEATDAAEVAFRVGYDSPSQFSREYARMFGLPPISDIKRLRKSLLASGS